MPFLFIFVIFPLLEIFVFARVTAQMGFGTALGLLFLSALVGSAILGNQGLRSTLSLRTALFDSFCITLAAILLIAPGFISDIMGLALLIPLVRNGLRAIIRHNTNWTMEKYSAQTDIRADIIEGECEHLEPEGPAKIDDKDV